MTPEAQAAQMATDDAREKVAEFMLAHSIATGHGDTIDDLLGELSVYVQNLRAELAETRKGYAMSIEAREGGLCQPLKNQEY